MFKVEKSAEMLDNVAAIERAIGRSKLTRTQLENIARAQISQTPIISDQLKLWNWILRRKADSFFPPRT